MLGVCLVYLCDSHQDFELIILDHRTNFFSTLEGGGFGCNSNMMFVYAWDFFFGRGLGGGGGGMLLAFFCVFVLFFWFVLLVHNTVLHLHGRLKWTVGWHLRRAVVLLEHGCCVYYPQPWAMVGPEWRAPVYPPTRGRATRGCTWTHSACTWTHRACLSLRGWLCHLAQVR